MRTENPLTTSALRRLRGGALPAWYCAWIISCRALLYEPSRLFSMPSAMNYMAPRGVSVVCRLFVMSGIVVFGGLLVVMGGMLEVF